MAKKKTAPSKSTDGTGDNTTKLKKLKIKSSIEVLFSWNAPERIWQEKGREWYVSYALLFAFFMLLATLMDYVIIVFGLLALMLLVFVQARVKPWNVEHRITTKGIFTHNQLFTWEQIKHFWFAKKKDQLVLYIDFPTEQQQPRLMMLLADEFEYDVFTELIEYLPYANPLDAEYYFFSKWMYGAYIPVSKYIGDLDAPAT